MYLDISYIWMHSNNYVSRKTKTTYSLEQICDQNYFYWHFLQPPIENETIFNGGSPWPRLRKTTVVVINAQVESVTKVAPIISYKINLLPPFIFTCHIRCVIIPTFTSLSIHFKIIL
jgi:hypothetical protein